MADQNGIDEITTKMMEYVCDHLCRFSNDIKDQEILDGICDSCQIAGFVFDVLNQYNQNVQRWIPVTEGLPEPNMDVLVAVRDFGEDTSTLLDCLVEHNGRLMWNIFHGAQEQVLAWRPLPERYRPMDKGESK